MARPETPVPSAHEEIAGMTSRLAGKLRRMVDEQEAPEANGGLPDTWQLVRVATLLRESPINGTSPPGSDPPPGVPALRLNALADPGLDYRAIRYIKIDEATADQLAIMEGDFFVARGNGSLSLVGRGTLASAPPVRTVFPDTMIRLRFHDRELARWVATIWPARPVRLQIEQIAKTTAGIWKISQPDVMSVSVPLPPRAERDEIVRCVNALSALADMVERRRDAASSRCADATRSILATAFRGALVPGPSPTEGFRAMKP